jgi:hypothetical protein
MLLSVLAKKTHFYYLSIQSSIITTHMCVQTNLLFFYETNETMSGGGIQKPFGPQKRFPPVLPKTDRFEVQNSIFKISERKIKTEWFSLKLSGFSDLSNGFQPFLFKIHFLNKKLFSVNRRNLTSPILSISR